jgi:hypothetical protein
VRRRRGGDSRRFDDGLLRHFRLCLIVGSGLCCSGLFWSGLSGRRLLRRRRTILYDR